MKKIIVVAVLVFAALTASGVGVVSAQTDTPPTGGNGSMHGRGMLHSFMVTAFAEQLDLNIDDVTARLAAGETLRVIALSEGVTVEELPVLMQAVRATALDAAVEAGVITQEQADWMTSHRGGRLGTADCTGTGMQNQPGGKGHGNGMMGNP